MYFPPVAQAPEVFSSDFEETTVIETRYAIFTTHVVKSGKKVRWFYDSVELEESENVMFVEAGSIQKLVIKDITGLSSGTLTVVCDDQSMTTNVVVKGRVVKAYFIKHLGSSLVCNSLIPIVN